MAQTSISCLHVSAPHWRTKTGKDIINANGQVLACSQTANAAPEWAVAMEIHSRRSVLSLSERDG